MFIEKLKTFYNKHFWIIVAVWIIGIAAIIYWLGSGPSEDEVLQQTVTNQTIQANKAVQEATNANNAAINASIERLSEDAVRKKVIAPKLEQTRRKSQTSKAALREAQKTYNEQKSNTSNLSRNSADNCIDLGSLFPNVTFEECQ